MDQEFPTYEEMATALAVYAYARSSEDGLYCHCAENGFEVGPHILDRLNVMVCEGTYANFAIRWHPGQPLPIWRNVNEPAQGEFEIALVHLVRWWSRTAEPYVRPTEPFLAAAPRKPHENSNPGPHHFAYAHWLTLSCIQRLGLGGGLESGFLMLNERGEAVPEYWEYWTPENRRRHLAKREPTRRQRAELKRMGVIHPDRARYI